MTQKRVLLHKDGSKVEVGDHVKSFRGENYIVTGWAKNGHNRVYANDEATGGPNEFFPSVFDMVWEDQK